MLARDALPRWSQPVWVAAAAGAVALLGLIAGIVGGEGELRYSGIPRLEFPIPRPAGEQKAGAGGGDQVVVEAVPPAAVRPAAIDPDLMEDGTYGPLPRVGRDGARAAVAYARPFDASDARPRVAIVVSGLGLQSELTEAAMALPGPVTLQFSPYTPELPALIEAAHRAGHEVLLELPMEPVDYPHSDPGPHTLLAAASTEGNLDRLLWLLARGTGYFGVTGAGGRFARSGEAVPVLDVLAARGLALVELGSDELRAAAQEAGLPYAHTVLAIDDVPSSRAIDDALASLERAALEAGSSLGIAQTYPITLERLRLWAAMLAERDLLLVPASALVLGRTGGAAGRDGDGARLSVSRG